MFYVSYGVNVVVDPAFALSHQSIQQKAKQAPAISSSVRIVSKRLTKGFLFLDCVGLPIMLFVSSSMV